MMVLLLGEAAGDMASQRQKAFAIRKSFLILPIFFFYIFPAAALAAFQHHPRGTGTTVAQPTATTWRHRQPPQQRRGQLPAPRTARQERYEGRSLPALKGGSLAASNGLAISTVKLVDADAGVTSSPATGRDPSPVQAQQLPQSQPQRARSVFGTREYWDEMYQGRGDFPSDEYSWYYGWDTLKRHVAPYLHKDDRLLLPGIGNDPMLLDLVQSNYRSITAQDYSVHALQRQKDLLQHYLSDEALASAVTMVPGDVRHLPAEWDGKYDAVVEKGLLDAVYLSGDGNVELAVASLFRALRSGGIFVSVSGVVPDELRRQLF
jgi:Methyltransferase domain